MNRAVSVISQAPRWELLEDLKGNSNNRSGKIFELSAWFARDSTG